MAARKKGRNRDQYLLIPIWTSVDQNEKGTSYQFPSSGEDTLFNIQEAGMCLQKAVATENQGGASRLVTDFLLSHATLSRSEEDNRLERFAAAYHLWPYYAAQYYGYLDTEPEVRREAQKRLCDIQKLLYNNTRRTLDFLRICFPVLTDKELKDYLVGDQQRSKWRDEALIKLKEDVPDLCAVDSLAAHILDLEDIQQEIEKVEGLVHAASLQHEKPSSEICLKVQSAFLALNVAQITVFQAKGGYFRLKEENPILEEITQVWAPSKDLLPFHIRDTSGNWCPDTDADAFRRLAHAVYTCLLTKTIFKDQKRLTLTRIEKAERYVSDGDTTLQFIQGVSEVSQNGMTPYATFLRGLPSMAADIRDWSDPSWWGSPQENEMRTQLFGSNCSEIHQNSHLSAFWDHLSPSDIALKCDTLWKKAIANSGEVTGKRFGYLMELLLRIRASDTDNHASFRVEEDTRTSFFLALGQGFEKAATLENNNEIEDRLTGFIGGTFLGLERPGIPYCEVRYATIVKRMRGLVLVLANYFASRAVYQQRRNQAQHQGRRDILLNLLEDPEPPFARNQTHSEMTDKNPLIKARQEKGVLTHNIHKSARCEKTLKSLFLFFDIEPGKTSRPNDVIELKWKAIRGARPVDPTTCEECVMDVWQFLLIGNKRGHTPSIMFEGREISLPSKPGLRFLVGLADFVWAVHDSDSAPDEGELAVVKSVKWFPDRFEIDFSRIDFPHILLQALARAKLGVVTGEFKNLIACNPELPSNLSPQLRDVLMRDDLRCKIDLHMGSTSEIVQLFWKIPEEGN